MSPEQQAALVATALAFAREGAKVVAVDISEQGNQETVHLIEDLGGQAISVQCDVTRSEDIKAALNKTIEAFGCRLAVPRCGCLHGWTRDGGQTVQ